MKIKYKQISESGKEIEIESGVRWWLEGKLHGGGIEGQIKKLQDLLALVTSELLESNPDLLRKVSEVVKCNGFHHHIVPNQDI